MNSDLNLWDLVKLDSNKTVWEIGTKNPINSIGMVTEIDNGWVYVKWDNGIENTYRTVHDDLILLENIKLKPLIAEVLEANLLPEEAAYYIAFEAHKGQEYGDEPYCSGHIFKVVNLAKKRMGLYFYESQWETIVCCAYLHDVIEDTDITYDDLLRVFSRQVVDIVVLLTKAWGESYQEYLMHIGANPIAAFVKWCDACVNAQKCLSTGSIDRANHYIKVMKEMSNHFGEQQ